MNLLWWLALVLLPASVLAQSAKLDPNIPAYKPIGGIIGELKSIGSGTMQQLMTLWAEEFAKFYPEVKLEAERKPSSAAPKALMAGSAQLGPMSRAMTPAEIDDFEKRYRFKPTELRTSLDALAVYVHKDNPINGLARDQLDAIFSKTRRGGHKDNITSWGQLGLKGEWVNHPIALYGLPPASGTHGFFKEEVLLNGDFKDGVKEVPGSERVIQAVTEDRYGITYSGIGFRTLGVRPVPLAKKAGDPFRAATYDEAITGNYPLTRFLYIYIVKDPAKPLSPLVREFAKFIFSRQGQEVVVKADYLPLSSRLIEAELKKLD